jgi:hypothetical protein
MKAVAHGYTSIPIEVSSFDDDSLPVLIYPDRATACCAAKEKADDIC